MSYYAEIDEIAAIGDTPWREYRLIIGGKKTTPDGRTVVIPSERVAAWINGEVAGSLDSFSVSEQTGYWKGAREQSWTISVLSEDPGTAETLRDLARRYNRRENQECCLLSIHPVNAVEFIFTRAKP